MNHDIAIFLSYVLGISIGFTLGFFSKAFEKLLKYFWRKRDDIQNS